MPELPEVETMVRDVREELVGQSFVNVSFFRADIRALKGASRMAPFREVRLGNVLRKSVAILGHELLVPALDSFPLKFPKRSKQRLSAT